MESQNHEVGGQAGSDPNAWFDRISNALKNQEADAERLAKEFLAPG